MVKKEKIDQLLHSLWKEGDISYNRALQDVQIALDSMNEEQVSDKLGGINNALSQDKLAMKYVDEAMAEVEKKAQAFTEAHKGEDSEIILAEMRGEEIASEELEEAAKTYAKKESHGYEPCNIVKTFKAGAKWQKQKDENALNENALLYIGKAEMKQQMMAKAVDGIARPDDNEIWCNLASSNLKDGDKVKVIVIKED